jgi:regulatory protein
MSARPPKSLRHQALDCLARREYSRLELQQRLSQRNPEAGVEDIATVLDQLQEDQLQDDHRFAQGFTRLRVMRGHGPLKIAYELQQKGVTRDCVDAAIAAHDWSLLAQEALNKKFGDAKATTWEERAKRLRFLQQRGFDAQNLEL